MGALIDCNVAGRYQVANEVETRGDLGKPLTLGTCSLIDDAKCGLTCNPSSPVVQPSPMPVCCRYYAGSVGNGRQKCSKYRTGSCATYLVRLCTATMRHIVSKVESISGSEPRTPLRDSMVTGGRKRRQRARETSNNMVQSRKAGFR